MPKKPDEARIATRLQSLVGSTSLGSRKWWPKYVYHSAHVENVASILHGGRLLSRARALSASQLITDCASPDIIAQLSATEKQWVRLYFRPRAPTQYANEGVRPKHEYKYGAHMPVPVYLLFTASSLLTEEGVSFTRGRLEEGTDIGHTADFFESIPFRDVYHDSGVGPIGSPRRSDILNARHAEVLVPDELALDHLRHIICRSAPERETLLGLLTSDTRALWRKRVIVQTHQNLFYKRGTYIESVDLSSDHSVFNFYAGISASFRGPYEVKFTWLEGSWQPEQVFHGYHVPTDPLRFQIASPQPRYIVTVQMDGNLVYRGRFAESTEPEVF